MKIYPHTEVKQTLTILGKDATLDLIHVFIKQDQVIPRHKADERALVICTQGQVDFETDDQKACLTPGCVLDLAPQEYHLLKGLVDSHLIVIKLK